MAFESGAKGVGTTTICGRLAGAVLDALVPPVCEPPEVPPVEVTGFEVGAGVAVGTGVAVGVGVGVPPPPLPLWLPEPVGLGVGVGVAVGVGVGVAQA
jgi:hypothetical protein